MSEGTLAKKKLRLAGNFVELGWDQVDAPSLVEQRGKRDRPHKERVVAYLRAGLAFIVSPGYDDDIFDRSRVAGTGTIATDGVYAWPRSLAYYVETYDVALPSDFEAHMERNHWKMPERVDTMTVELPPSGR